MPKIKIRDFKGIFTNIDQNDQRFELVRDSVNFKHKRGFLEFDPRYLSTRDSLPDPNLDFNSYTWIWETGIYTTLASDVLTNDDVPIPAKHDVLVLIAVAEDSGTYHRLIYLYDETNSEGWYEMSNKGGYTAIGGIPIIDIVNHEGGNDFSNSFFSTTIDGATHFQVEDGRLKIYMPHDTFWLGKIQRKIYLRDESHRWPQTDPGGGADTYPFIDMTTADGAGYWYVDRVLEKWKHGEQYLNFDWSTLFVSKPQVPFIVAQAPLTYGALKCAHPYSTTSSGTGTTSRRTGITIDLELDDDPTTIIDRLPVVMGDPHDDKIRAEQPQGGLRCLRHTIKDRETLVNVNNPNLPIPENPGIWLWILDKDRSIASGIQGGDFDDWDIGAISLNDLYVYFNEEQALTWVLQSGDAWSTLGSYQAKSTGNAWFNGTQVSIDDFHMEFSISIYDLLNNNIEYGGSGTNATLGWTTADTEFSIVVTAVLDEREEIPMLANNYVVSPSDKYSIRVKEIVVPYDINKRLTRIRFYHQLKDGADYDMVKEFNLLTAENAFESFMFTTNEYSGTSLASNIGFLWDYWEAPHDLRYINGYKDFVTESGVSIGISSRDEVAIYYSTFGGGNLMPDLVYDDNRLPITGVSSLTAVANADGRLIAFTPHTSYAIKAEEVSGVLGFIIEDTIELGVKDKFDVANAQGGVIVHTVHGIYLTNGFETTLMSEAIDNVVKDNYSTGRIYYNRYLHEIYYKPTEAEDLYRFRAKDGVWERTNKTITSDEAELESKDVQVD